MQGYTNNQCWADSNSSRGINSLLAAQLKSIK